ncbi:hypothetical protein [Brevundimonas balnearis]|uniref:Uncharacterized protein n=1 Tax=Brevundimonas balnearis TaxID=1572858 RepID=A0ABV6R1H4_9CAUL
MTQTPKIGVVIMPTIFASAWLSALAHAAKDVGWRAFKAAAPQPAGDAPAIVIFRDLSEIALHPTIDRWIVIGSSDLEPLLAGALVRNPDAGRATRSATAALALYEVIAPVAERVIEADAACLTVPGLGDVRRDPEAGVEPRPQIPEAARRAVAMLERPLGSRVGVWGPEVMSFTRGQDPEGGSADIDLTGRTRILAHGPHLTLPAGAWECVVRLAVMPDDEAKLMFEWGSGEDVHRAHTVMIRPGEYEVALEHSWSKPQAVEIRIWAERGHFSGSVRFHEATVRWLAQAPGQVPTP